MQRILCRHSAGIPERHPPRHLYCQRQQGHYRWRVPSLTTRSATIGSPAKTTSSSVCVCCLD
jgi:hypothetical protein